MQLTIVRVIVLNDLLGLVLDRVLNGAGIRRHVILDLGLALSILAAALCELRGKGVGILHICDSIGIDGLLGCIEALKQRGVHGVEAVAHTAVDAVELVQHRLGIESSLEVAIGCRSFAASITTPGTIAPATENGEENDENPPAVTISESIVVTISIGNRCNVCKRRSCIHHNIYSLGCSGL